MSSSRTARILVAALLGVLAAYPADQSKPSQFAKGRGSRLPAGTRLQVRLLQSLDTSRNRAGDRFVATLHSPVVVNGRVAVPRGARFTGHVANAQPSGRLKGRGILEVRLDAFEWNGRRHSIV